jgi:beta-fructofuranosidase
MPRLVYQPEGYSVGDAMPFYEKGVYYFYHYKSAAGRHEEAQNWTLSTTRDFVSYTDHGELFHHGEKGEQDYVFRSGTLLKKDDRYHFFYGGDNGREIVLHASGVDIARLEKDGFRLQAEAGYGPEEWRDPFVAWCGELDAYIMLVGTRKANGKHHNGCTVWFTSRDLANWEFRGDFWAPDQYTTHEMPDLFKLGNFWYHIVSEYSDNTQVIYRRGSSPAGPWELMSDGALDGPAYFAGRTCADDEGNRYLVGWIAGKNIRDDRAPWGGVSGLWVHRIIRQEDGSLGEALPDSVYRAFAGRRPLVKEPVVVEASCGKKETVPVPVAGGPGTDPFMLEAVVEVEKGTYAFSLNLLENPATGEAYEYRFIIPENRIVLSQTPNHGVIPKDHFRGMEKISRHVPLLGRETFHIQIVYDDSYVILYAGCAALSGRLYGGFGGCVSASVLNGNIRLREFSVREGLRPGAGDA